MPYMHLLVNLYLSKMSICDLVVLSLCVIVIDRNHSRRAQVIDSKIISIYRFHFLMNLSPLLKVGVCKYELVIASEPLFLTNQNLMSYENWGSFPLDTKS